MTPATYAQRLIARLYRRHAIAHHRTEIRDVPRSFTHFPEGQPQIVLSRASLRHAYQHGFQEYPAVCRALGLAHVTGLAAVHRLCLHEFAHVLQYREGALRRRAVHSHAFVRHYRELLKHYPYQPLNSD